MYEVHAWYHTYLVPGTWYAVVNNVCGTRYHAPKHREVGCVSGLVTCFGGADLKRSGSSRRSRSSRSTNTQNEKEEMARPS